MKELYEKNKKKIVICVVILIILILLWLIIIGPFVKFKQNEKTVLEAAKRYYEINNSALPTGKRISTISLQKLYDKDLISTDLTSSYTSKLCDSKNSWVKVRKENNEYKYYVYLKCGIYSSDIDHDGPVITLKGNDYITVNKGDSWTDPGISSVIDNTDGNIDTKEVKVKSNVNLNKNGTYTITYTVRDNFKNETVKTRTVKVVQILDQVVKKDTKNTNGYYKDNIKYIKIDGITFEIVGINDDGTVKVVSNETLGYVDKDGVDEWLNDYFYNKLSDNAKKYIVSSKFCNEKTTNPESYTKCNKYSSKKNVGLLSVADINNSSINMAIKFKALTSNELYYTSTEYKEVKKDDLYGIIPTLNLKKDIYISSGNGSINKPFNIPGNKYSSPGTKVTELKAGEYISYSGYNWRVVGKNENENVQVVLDERVMDTSDEVQNESFGTKIYSTTDNNNLGYIIINKTSKYIATSIFEKEKIKVYKYDGIPKYNKNVKYSEYSAKLFELSMFDLFAGSYNQLFWFRESNNKNGIAYLNRDSVGITTESIKNDGISIRLTAFISKNKSVVSGKGTDIEPYKIK